MAVFDKEEMQRVSASMGSLSGDDGRVWFSRW